MEDDMTKSTVMLLSILFIMIPLSSVTAYEAVAGATGVLKYDRENPAGSISFLLQW
jgi:hypothetical protein